MLLLERPVKPKIALSVIALFLLGVVAYLPFNPAAVQARRMKAVEQHIDTVLEPLLAADPRFGKVELYSFTGSDPVSRKPGTLSVSGGVASQEDLAALKAVIIQSAPPCGFVFRPSVNASTGEPGNGPTATSPSAP